MRPVKLRYILGGLCAGGLLLQALPTLVQSLAAWPLVAASVVALGEALLVAAFLGATFDAWMKQRMVDRIVHNLSPHIMGADLPPELREEVWALCSTKLFRRGLKVTYGLHPEGADQVLLECEVEYFVINSTMAPLPYVQTVLVEKSPNLPKDFISISNIGAEQILDADTELQLTYDDNAHGGEGLGADSDSGFDRVWRRKVLIPPGNSDKPARFWSTRRQLFPKEATDVFFSLMPTIDVTVVVRHDPRWMVRVDIPRRDGLVDLQPVGFPPRWHRPQGFVPVSAFTISWREKRRAGGRLI